jgi:hypothetical protein
MYDLWVCRSNEVDGSAKEFKRDSQNGLGSLKACLVLRLKKLQTVLNCTLPIACHTWKLTASKDQSVEVGCPIHTFDPLQSYQPINWSPDSSHTGAL